MTPDAAMSFGPAVSHQLLHLVLAALVALLAGLVPALVGAWRRRRWPEAVAPRAEATPRRGGWRLLAAAVLALVTLPALVALRQLWPHPALRWPALITVVALLVLGLIGWSRAGREAA